MKDRLCVWSRYVNYEMWFFPRLTETTFRAIFYLEQVKVEEKEEVIIGIQWNKLTELVQSPRETQSNNQEELRVSLCCLFGELEGLREGLSRSSPFKELHPGSWCWSAAFQGLASGVPPWCTSELIWPQHPPAGASIFSALVWFMRLFLGKIFTPEPDADVVSTGSAAQELIWLPPPQAPQAQQAQQTGQTWDEGGPHIVDRRIVVNCPSRWSLYLAELGLSKHSGSSQGGGYRPTTDM